MSRDRALLLALALAGTVTGCGQGEEAGSAPVTRAETALSTSTLDPGDCDGGDTAPLTVEELLKGMRAAGYDMYVDPGCNDDSVETDLRMLNLVCTITPDPTKAQQQIDRLEKTLNELAAKSD